MAVPLEYLNITCLVVDDEASIRRTIVNMLRQMGFKKIQDAEDGKAAFAILQSVSIDIVLCDINIPEMTGIELFKVIRANKKYNDVIFIFLTAEARRDTVARAGEEGGAAYIIKPFVMSTLENKITEALKRKFKPSELEVYLKDFQKHMKAMDLGKAEEEIKKALEIQPESPTILFNLGQLSIFRGETDKAVEFFKKTIEKKPLFVKAHDALGKIYENNGDNESAIKYYGSANRISGANTDRLITLSKLYNKSGNSEKAENLLKKAATDIRQDDSTSNHLVGEMYLAKNENEKALEVLSIAYKKNSSDPSIMESLAEAYRKTGKPEMAVELYGKIISLNPNNSSIYHYIGKTYIEMGDKKLAIRAITKAWELNPASKEITNDLKALAEKDKINL